MNRTKETNQTAVIYSLSSIPHRLDFRRLVLLSRSGRSLVAMALNEPVGCYRWVVELFRLWGALMNSRSLR